MDHALVEQLAGLSSRIKSLRVSYNDAESKKLMDLQDKLVSLFNDAMERDMQADNEQYQSAVNQLSQAITIIGEGNEKVDKIEEIINVVTKAIDLAGKAIGIAMKL
jgi:hypothetical protein